jgi:hypothetical protein
MDSSQFSCRHWGFGGVVVRLRRLVLGTGNVRRELKKSSQFRGPSAGAREESSQKFEHPRRHTRNRPRDNTTTAVIAASLFDTPIQFAYYVGRTASEPQGRVESMSPLRLPLQKC